MEMFISSLCSMGYFDTAATILREVKKLHLKDRHSYIFNVTELMLFRLDGPEMEKAFLLQLPLAEAEKLESQFLCFDAPTEKDKKKDLIALLEDVRAVIPTEDEVSEDFSMWADLFSTYAGIRKKYGLSRDVVSEAVRTSRQNVVVVLSVITPNSKGGSA